MGKKLSFILREETSEELSKCVYMSLKAIQLIQALNKIVDTPEVAQQLITPGDSAGFVEVFSSMVRQGITNIHSEIIRDVRKLISDVRRLDDSADPSQYYVVVESWLTPAVMRRITGHNDNVRSEDMCGSASTLCSILSMLHCDELNDAQSLFKEIESKCEVLRDRLLATRIVQYLISLEQAVPGRGQDKLSLQCLSFYVLLTSNDVKQQMQTLISSSIRGETNSAVGVNKCHIDRLNKLLGEVRVQRLATLCLMVEEIKGYSAKVVNKPNNFCYCDDVSCDYVDNGLGNISTQLDECGCEMLSIHQQID